MKKPAELFRGVLLALLVATGAAGATADEADKIRSQQSELQQIQRDVEAGQARLDSLQRQQSRVQNAISNYDEKITSDRQVIRRLSRELNQLQSDITRGDSLLADRRELFERRTRRHLGNIRQFYTLAQQPLKAISDSPNEELEYHRKIKYLTALADFESTHVRDASVLVDQSTDELTGMSGRQQMISGLKKDRETSFAIGKSQQEREKKSLDQLHRKSMAEADRVIMLRQAALEMKKIIARLEEAQARAEASQQVPSGPSAFAAQKSQLAPPFRGKITAGFGQHVDPVTRLRSFSPGITIKGRAHGSVLSIATGMVAYTGSLRGYGNFVIINHDHQYYTTYAGLGEILVADGQYLPSGTKVGTSGKDGIIKFEIRQGHEPLDPVEWINIESL